MWENMLGSVGNLGNKLSRDHQADTGMPWDMGGISFRCSGEQGGAGTLAG